MTEKPPRPPLAVIRPFTTHVFNPISRRFVRWLPGFGILVYRGRKSGKEYRTPLNVFRHGDEWVFALTYGSDVQWVKNVARRRRGDARGSATEASASSIPSCIVDPERRLMPFRRAPGPRSHAGQRVPAHAPGPARRKRVTFASEPDRPRPAPGSAAPPWR